MEEDNSDFSDFSASESEYSPSDEEYSMSEDTDVEPEEPPQPEMRKSVNHPTTSTEQSNDSIVWSSTVANYVPRNGGVLAAKWVDSKEVIVLTNCHPPIITNGLRKMKDGKKVDVPIPLAIKSYNEIMGGVDLADQRISTYVRFGSKIC